MLERFKLRQVPYTREMEIKNRFQIPFIESEVIALKKTIDNRMSGLLVAPAGTGKLFLLERCYLFCLRVDIELNI